MSSESGLVLFLEYGRVFQNCTMPRTIQEPRSASLGPRSASLGRLGPYGRYQWRVELREQAALMASGKRIAELRNQMHDVIFRVSEGERTEEFRAHRIVLAAGSDFFHAKFTTELPCRRCRNSVPSTQLRHLGENRCVWRNPQFLLYF